MESEVVEIFWVAPEFFEVAALSHGNTLLNADEGDGGLGSRVNLGDVAAGETVEVAFEIGLQVLSPFEFFVDAFGIP